MDWIRDGLFTNWNFGFVFDPRLHNLQRFVVVLFIQWCECYARCNWSLPKIYWSTDTWMTSRETCFLCFVQHGARFVKMFVRLIWIQASESLEKKISKSYLHYLYYKEKKNGEKETKRALYNLRMPKLKRNLHNSCLRVSLRDSLFCKMFSPLFCFEQKKTLKNVSKNP